MTERKRYEPDHWARDPDPEAALAKYLEMYDEVFNQVKTTIFDRLLGKSLQGLTVLDYGGGAGFMSVLCALKGARVLLVEAEANALSVARLYAQKQNVAGNIEFVHSESFPLELKDRGFDIVLAKDIIEHIAEDGRFLADLAACQNPGGKIILSTQNSLSFNYLLEGSYQRLWLKHKDWCGWNSTHLRFYTPFSLGRLLRQAGYRPRRWRGLYIIPYDILSWLTLLRKRITLDGLRRFDLVCGGIFPFNRLGWDVIVQAEKRGR